MSIKKIFLKKNKYKLKELIKKKILKKKDKKILLKNKDEKIKVKDINKIYKNKIKIIKKKFLKRIIVPIIGNVNNGKTTFIKNIKKIEIKELKNITQDISIYNFKEIIFIDTPGHEFFNSVKKKMIKISDIVIILLSINEKINNEIKSKINYIISKKKKFVIAINKIDIKKNKNNIIIKNYILSLNKKIKIFKISAKFLIGIDKIINYIKKVNTKKKTKKSNKNKAIIINSNNINKEPVFNIILQNGMIKTGNYIYDKKENLIGKVKKIFSKNNIKNYCFAISAIAISGINKKIKIGKKIIFKEKKLKKNNKLKQIDKKKNKENKIDKILNKKKVIKIYLIAENLNFIDSIKKFLKKFKKFEIIREKISYIITEKDRQFIKKTKIKIIFFNRNIKKSFFESKNIYSCNLVYKIKDFIKKILKKTKKKILILKTFKLKNNIKILGCKIIKGNIKINDSFILYRNERTIKKKILIKSIKILKKNVKKVNKNETCGIQLLNYNKIKKNDILKSYDN